MKSHLLCTALFTTLPVAFWFSPAQTGPEKPPVIDVFPGKVPGAKGEPKEDKVTGKGAARRVVEVTKPTLTVFRPAKDKDTGVAVIIAPGGAYSQLAIDHEGEEVAAWLNSIGVTGIVLRYRIPGPKGQSRDDANWPARQDAQRAVSLVRFKAKDWAIDPTKIGMIGFSAGGHLTAMTATNFDKRGYEDIDDVDKVSCRPDFAVLVYPAYLLEKDKLVPSLRVTKQTPPTMFVHSGDDMFLAEASVQMYLALKKVGVPAELHVYTTGGHGFGIRASNQPVAQWPKRCEDWLRSQKILKAAQGP